MTFQPRFKGSIPSDLSVSLILTEGKLLQPITLERKAGVPSPDLSSSSSQDSASDFKEKHHEHDRSREKSHEKVEGADSSSSEGWSSIIDVQIYAVIVILDVYV